MPMQPTLPDSLTCQPGSARESSDSVGSRHCPIQPGSARESSDNVGHAADTARFSPAVSASPAVRALTVPASIARRCSSTLASGAHDQTSATPLARCRGCKRSTACPRKRSATRRRKRSAACQEKRPKGEPSQWWGRVDTVRVQIPSRRKAEQTPSAALFVVLTTRCRPCRRKSCRTA
jgi:hypothetical protein